MNNNNVNGGYSGQFRLDFNFYNNQSHFPNYSVSADNQNNFPRSDSSQTLPLNNSTPSSISIGTVSQPIFEQMVEMSTVLSMAELEQALQAQAEFDRMNHGRHNHALPSVTPNEQPTPSVANQQMEEVIFDNQEDAICPITQSDFEDAVKTPCGHVFERAGILKWLSQKSECPLDRKPLNLDQLKSVKVKIVKPEKTEIAPPSTVLPTPTQSGTGLPPLPPRPKAASSINNSPQNGAMPLPPLPQVRFGEGYPASLRPVISNNNSQPRTPFQPINMFEIMRKEITADPNGKFANLRKRLDEQKP